MSSSLVETYADSVDGECDEEELNTLVLLATEVSEGMRDVNELLAELNDWWCRRCHDAPPRLAWT